MIIVRPSVASAWITFSTSPTNSGSNAEVGSSNAAFVGDEVTDRFCVLGEVDEHVAKLEELADVGVDQFNIYLMNGDEEAQLDAYASIVPRFAG